MQESKLYVGNLSYSLTESKLEEAFSKHGTVKEVVIIKDKYTDRSKGFGFIEMSAQAEAQSAIEALNGTDLDGRSLKVNIARPKSDDNRRNGGGGGGGEYRKRY